MLLGEFIVREGLATKEQVEEALKEQTVSGGRLGEILSSMFAIRALDYYRALSRFYGLEFVDLVERAPDLSLLDERERVLYSSRLEMPVWMEGAQRSSPPLTRLPRPSKG